MKYDWLIDDMVFSYSRLTSYEQCNYGWLLDYVLHEPKEESFFSEYGSFMHAIIAKILTGEIDKNDAPFYYMRHFVEEVPSPATSDALKAKYYTSGLEYLRHFDFPHKNIVAVEESVRFEINGIPFVGYVDVISEEDGQLIITDHKSHDLSPFSKKYPTKKTKSDLDLESYLRQLILYAYGVKQKYGRYPAALEFNCFKAGNYISIPFKEEWVEPTLKWASELRDQIRNESEWRPSIDFFYCKNLCDMREVCEYCNEV